MPYRGTDWVPAEDTVIEKEEAVDDVPGILTFKCIFDRAGNHNYHGETKNGLSIGGQPVVKGSVAEKIVTQAMNAIKNNKMVDTAVDVPTIAVF
jgi:hypothetical protein